MGHEGNSQNTLNTLFYFILCSPWQVETIGDAYMVVGGVPVPVESHAQRVANFALGMRISAKEVMNPVTGEPIQVGSKGALRSRQNITHESKVLVCSGRLGGMRHR